MRRGPWDKTVNAILAYIDAVYAVSPPQNNKKIDGSDSDAATAAAEAPPPPSGPISELYHDAIWVISPPDYLVGHIKK